MTNPVIPAINAYGSMSTTTSHLTRPSHLTHASHTSVSSHSSDSDERSPLLPGMVAPGKNGLISGVSRDLIPFSGIVTEVAEWFSWHREKKHPSPPTDGLSAAEAAEMMVEADALGGMSERHYWTHAKHRPRIAGGGENVPIQIVRSLTCWLSVCEERGCVPGEWSSADSMAGSYSCSIRNDAGKHVWVSCWL